MTGPTYKTAQNNCLQIFTVLSRDHVLFMAVSLVNRVSRNLSSFPTGYNWVNQICNHDHATNVTFKDKFHLIRHDKPESATHGPSFPLWACGLPGNLHWIRLMEAQPLRWHKKLLLPARNTDNRGVLQKEGTLTITGWRGTTQQGWPAWFEFLILDNILRNVFTHTD